MDNTTDDAQKADTGKLKQRLGTSSLVLIGLMGAGKSTVGRRLAAKLNLTFVDADTAIEEAAGMSIADIFTERGEAEFRAGEVRVIQRLLEGGPQVLATGGGAYMNETTRRNIKARGISIWLKADLDTLMKRVRRKQDRPLLKSDNPEAVMRRLMDERYPIYAGADMTVASRETPHEIVVEDILRAISIHLLGEETPP